MDFLALLYQLLIGPLELFFEIVFTIAYRFLGDPGLSIVFLSLAMNFLVLPLYRRADAMQEEERVQAEKMKPVQDHIRKTFKGDERFMMMQTYNRQVGYKPTDALKGSVSLLLEIPFFIAAYHFISNLAVLQGVPFGPLADLGAPDGLLQVSGIGAVNVLPILMTAINLASAALYMKGMPMRNKVQMVGIAALFLVLLYASPSGLVFYWTLNNVFSLVKNVFYRLKRPRFVLSVMASAAGVLLIAASVFNPMSTPMKEAFVIGAGFFLQLPICVYFVRRKKPKAFEHSAKNAPSDKAFLLCSVFVALLTGALIPLSVIHASPTEFANLVNYQSPLWYVAYSLALSVGTFVIWFGVFYWLASPHGKDIFGCAMFVFAGIAIVDYLFFGMSLGNLSAELQYEN
ncbi:MAG: YidC/Oxa1 family membrane protein insertase, partial [Eggerthellaceae bacterium]|nr:YidC/Oxa1 family membrane protein insertase [Eggerthellaceae bacterium]